MISKTDYSGRQFLVSFPNVKLFTHFLATARLPMSAKEIMRHGVITIFLDVNRVMKLIMHYRVRH